MAPQVRRPTTMLSLGIAVSAIFLWIAGRNADGELILRALSSAELLWAPPFVAALIAFCWLKAVRWALLLAPLKRTSPHSLLPAVVLGYAGTAIMPMQLGELLRAYVASRRLNERFAAMLSSIALERVIDVLCFVLALGLVLLMGNHVGRALSEAGVLLTVGSIGVLSVLAAFAKRPDFLDRMVSRLTGRLGERMRGAILEHFAALSAGVAILRRPARYAAVVSVSLVQWAFMLVCAWISLRALGLDLPPSAALLVLATTLLGVSLPHGPGYLGTIQLAFVIALRPFGVDAEPALAASIFYHALLYLPLLLWAAFYVIRLQMTLRDIQISRRITRADSLVP